MSDDSHKPLLHSSTFIFLMILLFFNMIDEERMTFVFGYIDEIVNALLTFGAAWGRYKATKRIKGVINA